MACPNPKLRYPVGTNTYIPRWETPVQFVPAGTQTFRVSRFTAVPKNDWTPFEPAIRRLMGLPPLPQPEDSDE